jgi:hypothetical protein
MRAIRWPGWLTGARLQGLLQGRVVAIDVIEKVHLVVGLHNRSAVENQDGDRLVEVHLKIIGVAVHRRANSIGVPVGFVAQDPRRQGGRVFHANAAVAEIATRPGK